MNHSHQPHAAAQAQPAPLVSVCIAAYNHAAYIGQCLDSVLQQSCAEIEILVVDDASSDATPDIVYQYAQRHPQRIRAFFNTENLGPSRTANRAIGKARGEFVALLGSDDRMLPQRLAEQVAYLRANPQCVAVFSNIHAIDADGRRSAGVVLDAMENFFNQPSSNLRHRLLAHNVLNAPSAMIRTADLRAVGGFSPLLRYVQDYDLWIKLLLRGELGRLARALTEYRVHDRNLSLFGGAAPSLQARVETAAAVLYAARHWPLSNWASDTQPPDAAETARLQLALAMHLARTDYFHFKRPLVTTPHAYELVLAASACEQYTGHCAQLKQVLETWLDGGDAPTVVSGAPFAEFNPDAYTPGLSRQPLGIAQWLARRAPNEAQLQLIAQRCQDRGGVPRVAVAVRANGSADAAQATLRSLAGLHHAFVPERIYVVGGADTVQAQEPPQVRHVAAADAAQAIAAINRLAAECDCHWLLIVDAGDVFTAAGLMILRLELMDAPALRAVCADAMLRTDNGDLTAWLRPDFNLDLLLSMPSAVAGHWLYRRDVFVDAGGLDPACAEAAELDLLLRLVNAGGFNDLGHVHEPLLITQAAPIASRQAELDAVKRHLDARGYTQATVASHLPGCYRVLYGHPATPGVSIIIPTKNQLPMLQRCVSTLMAKTAYRNYEILIVDNGSDEADACAWLDSIESMGASQVRVLRYPHPFNYSAMNNLAARHARGDYLVLLNNDTAILREDWLDAMLNHAQRQEVGIVGAKLMFPDGRIQHAGVILGLRGPAEHPFIGEKLDDVGYMCRLQVDQDYSAVTGACLMVRKSLYEQVGGLDEQAFAVSYNDVDLCLKIRQAGYLIVWTPHALLLHEGSVSQAQVDTTARSKKLQRFMDEQTTIYERWLPQIARDPAYNLNLALHGSGFQVETNCTTSWRPLAWRPLPVTLALAADLAGCGHYRIIQPTMALDGHALAEAHWTQRHLLPAELERLSPDVLVLQRQFMEQNIVTQQKATRFSRAFKVAELDDYLPNLPRKSEHRTEVPKDVLKTMRKALSLVDRFVVSTPALAEALDGMHPDIRVVENRLPLSWWQRVQGLRRQGRRPRVGWGGGSSHRGDLELIADVVRSLAEEVEWVFLGMCPEALRPFVHEFHPGVPIDDYPARLAGLNLDLALAPLEDNLFNQCKSNLRLIEYGACGFPIVCSDVRPYRCDLPVTRVKQRHKDWVNAIRMHTQDLDAAAQAGDALRAAVQRDWMLDRAHAAHWLSQWMPD